MRSSVIIATWLSFRGVQTHALGPFEKNIAARADHLNIATTALKPLLSQNASVILPTDNDWDALQIRGTSPRIHPKFNAIVEPATEADVQKTVQFASKFGIPFLAVSGTHGWTKTLNNLPYGIQINMRKLNSVTVDPSGNTATIGGGTLQWEANKVLYAKGKQAVLTLCECTSIAGPMLAGGHSMLQARHGYTLDNLVSARVILANGTAVTASSSSNSDLFWALRGAGQSFGIVTSLQLNVYDIPSTWTISTFIYRSDKLEAVLDAVNKLDGDAMRSQNLVINGVGTRIPPMDPQNPMIIYTLSYQGPEAEALPYFSKFKAIGPITVKPSTNVNNMELYKITQNSVDSAACARNKNSMGSGVSLPSWNTTAARAAFNIFAKMTADRRFSRSVFLLENYGMQGVRAVDPSLTSLSLEERQYPAVANPTIWWNGTAAVGQADAEAYGEQIRQALFAGLPKGAKKHTYVNYAVGTENFNQMYGYDTARVQRLKTLKKAYDPENRFGFYNPVPLA
ncbi:FAD-binding domain-containing protein [Paraphaeosphaeria sporulosa]|uniref:FAD-binding domain-containing protein n=1 Tax=Paraphaeosphaeria sporulosa TaxID=1460663 RepID=A0A177CZV8_9PLEO|nr:FAD-binding domain-containing protein [Paraphaeosphaeria sporulosa]OAG12219.1 FAD-binding domain-containing protein [Paraphaeosphaeria sporulosa]